MNFENLLSVGAITQILENHKPANPVLQIIGYKPMTPDQLAIGNVTDELRYRLMIGDGVKSHQYCVITNQDIVDDIKSGRLEKWSIIRVTSYQTVDYGDGPPESRRRLIYILNLELVKKGSEVGQKVVCQPLADGFSANPPPMNQHLQQQSINRQPTSNFPDTVTQPQMYPMGGNRPDPIRSPRQVRSNYNEQTIGINELTPYIGKWIVKGRVTGKSTIREYNNAKGGGKLFNFTLADKTGEIKVTAFNADCERVYAYVEPNKVYLLGRASVKNADKRYTTADFEITLNSDSLLEEVIDMREINDVPMAKFNFISIGALPNLPPNQPVDLIGAITQVGEFGTIMSKTKNKELKKRNITIVDMSRHTISVTIWGDQAETFQGCVDDVFVTKAARVGSYGGRSASAGDSIFINPDIPEVRKIRNWYSQLLEKNFTNLTTTQELGGSDQWRMLAELTDMNKVKELTSTSQQSLYAKCKATIITVGKNPVYKCCPKDDCNKKLVDTQNGEMKCEKCQQTYSNYRYRYKTDIEIGDASASSWVTLWDEKAETIFNMKPDDLEKYMRMENKEAYEKIVNKPNFAVYIFTLRPRIDTYNNEQRVKLNVTSMVPVNTQTYCKRLIEEIKAMSAS